MYLPLLLLLLLLQTVASVHSSGSGGGSACAAADSLERLGDFFARNANGVDADGYFGLAITSITLDSASPRTLADRLSDCADDRLVDLQRTISGLHRVLGRFRSRSDASRTAYDRSVYGQICKPMEPILRRLLDPARFRWRHFGHSNATGGGGKVAQLVTAGISYRESVGDACFRGILANKRGRRCSISPTCRRFFLNSRPNMGYKLTHQFMYWTVAIDRSCHLKLSNGRPVDRSLLNDACRRAYSEHRAILGAGTAGYGHMDLAIEQAVLCGFLGHRDFFTDSTTLLLRRLQDERFGCYDNRIVAPTAGYPRAGASRTSTGRKLLHDVMLDGVCSSHTSGLAAAYFGFALRI